MSDRAKSVLCGVALALLAFGVGWGLHQALTYDDPRPADWERPDER